MLGINSKRPRYGPRLLTGWERFQTWRNARKAMVQRYINEGSAAGAALSAALVNNVQKRAELSAIAALKRVQTETQAKLAVTESKISEAQAMLKIDKRV